MDEQKKFLETAETEYGWYYPMLKVMLLTGMRISEVADYVGQILIMIMLQ